VGEGVEDGLIGSKVVLRKEEGIMKYCQFLCTFIYSYAVGVMLSSDVVSSEIFFVFVLYRKRS